MDYNRYPEIQAGGKPFKKMYIAIMLWVVGRAMQAAARTDRELKEEFAALRDDFLLKLWVLPGGPAMLVGKDQKGRVKYFGWKESGKKPTLTMSVKNLEAAMLMFTFQESTTIATARERLVVDGDLPDACAVVRVLNTVETYLLPKVIAKLAVKRYPKWSQMNPFKKHLGRIAVYARTFIGV